jgi:hypothetical protein
MALQARRLLPEERGLVAVLRIALVLKTGGEYKVEHAQILAKQIEKQAPFHEIVCLSDVEVPGVETIPLVTGERGWWAKMELYRPDIKGDLLFFDLDTIVRGPIDALLNVGRLTLLRDFYRDGVYKGRAEGLGSGLMYLPAADRAEAWAAWKTNPKRSMGGDQIFLETLWLQKAARWQDVVPGKIVSYKVHGTPLYASVICFHGKPRPWAVPAFQPLYQAA